MKVFMGGLKFDPQRLEEVVLARKLFKPNRLIAVSISSESYCELRRLKDYSEYRNLEHLRKDRFLFEHGANCLGISDIRHLRDPDRDELLRLFKRLTAECKASYAAGKRTAIIFMYAGHGIMSDMTFALMNTIDPKKMLFPIEKKVRQLAELQSTYVISLFNCCRDKVKIAKSKGGQTVVEANNLLEKDPYKDTRNAFLVYGRPPLDLLPQSTQIVSDFFELMKNLSDKDSRTVTLPRKAAKWKPSADGEVKDMTNHDIVFNYTEHPIKNSFEEISDDPLTIFMEMSSNIVTYAAVCISNVVKNTEKKIFACHVDDDIISYSRNTEKITMLRPFIHKQAVTLYSTCQVGQSLFQLGADSTTQLLIPDHKSGCFAAEKRRRHPYPASWNYS